MDLGGALRRALRGTLGRGLVVVKGAVLPEFDPILGSESTCFRLADLLGLGALLGGIITANKASDDIYLRSQWVELMVVSAILEKKRWLG